MDGWRGGWMKHTAKPQRRIGKGNVLIDVFCFRRCTYFVNIFIRVLFYECYILYVYII